MRNRTLVIFVCFAWVLSVMGQGYIPDPSLARDFAAQVKSINEFVARFNGDEAKPGLSLDSVDREKNLVSLCDFNMPHRGVSDEAFRKKLRDFIHTIINWNGRLSITEKTVLAEALCKIKYEGKEYRFTFILQREKMSNGNMRWAISDVKGVSALQLYSEKRLTISPVDHETHFMGLQDIFQENRKIVPATRMSGRNLDDMSFFFGLCVAKAIHFIQVDKLKFHFMDIPGYVFTVEEIGREGTNSGWLITNIQKMDDNVKEEYRQNMSHVQ